MSAEDIIYWIGVASIAIHLPVGMIIVFGWLLDRAVTYGGFTKEFLGYMHAKLKAKRLQG